MSRTNTNVALPRALTGRVPYKSSACGAGHPSSLDDRGANSVITSVCYVVKFVDKMREIVHIQAGQCGNQIGAKVTMNFWYLYERKI